MNDINESIWLVSDPTQENFLRKKTEDFDFSKYTKKDIQQLLTAMKSAMKKANGIGLSANQIGLPIKVFIASVPQANGGLKFYAVFNPVLEKESKEKILFEQGCLSVPGLWGPVERAEKIIVSGQDKTGKKQKWKLWGLAAQVFQHEIDHLNGILFIDKAKELQKAERQAPKKK